MKGFGIFLIIAAVVSLVLPFMGLQLLIFRWVDAWGLPTGLLIRLGIIALGALMVYLDRRAGTSEDI
ncbi:MAG: hypothetical protein HBSAPP03_18500 [Phycisphaerae bacterium]|nr:MAG: hypothetical protein HBSAPP03_18500 [Phycisphaerae bacterium]